MMNDDGDDNDGPDGGAGNSVEPYSVTHLPINSGERYAVLLTANQPPASYWIATETRFRALIKGFAVLQYDVTGGAAVPPLALPPAPPGPHPGAWSPEIQRMDAAYNAMMKNGTP
jgi:hypothetical protein